MNKVILMGRLTRNPEVIYSQQNLAIARYTLAVNRAAKTRQQGKQDVDFINCVAFGKGAEFAGKYFNQGQRIGIVGRIQVRCWEDNNGQKQWSTEVVVAEQYFVESKPKDIQNVENGFYPVEEDDDLPF